MSLKQKKIIKIIEKLIINMRYLLKLIRNYELSDIDMKIVKREINLWFKENPNDIHGKTKLGYILRIIENDLDNFFIEKVTSNFDLVNKYYGNQDKLIELYKDGEYNDNNTYIVNSFMKSIGKEKKFFADISYSLKCKQKLLECQILYKEYFNLILDNNINNNIDMDILISCLESNDIEIDDERCQNYLIQQEEHKSMSRRPSLETKIIQTKPIKFSISKSKKDISLNNDLVIKDLEKCIKNLVVENFIANGEFGYVYKIKDDLALKLIPIGDKYSWPNILKTTTENDFRKEVDMIKEFSNSEICPKLYSSGICDVLVLSEKIKVNKLQIGYIISELFDITLDEKIRQDADDIIEKIIKTGNIDLQPYLEIYKLYEININSDLILAYNLGFKNKDLHFKNIMIKYENDGKEKIKIVDWGLSYKRYSMPKILYDFSEYWDKDKKIPKKFDLQKKIIKNIIKHIDNTDFLSFKMNSVRKELKKYYKLIHNSVLKPSFQNTEEEEKN